MAITGAIPLPSSGLEGLFQGANATSSLLSQMMQRRSAMEQMDRLRQMLPLDKQLKQAQIKSAGMAHMLDPLRKQLLMEQIKAAHNKNDPTYAITQLQGLLSMLGEGEGDATQNPLTATPASEMPSYIPSIGGAGAPGDNQPAQPQGNNKELESFITSLMPQLQQAGAPKQEPIPEPKQDIISEYDVAQAGNNAAQKPKGIFDKEYLKKALIYKALGIPVPRESTSGYTPEMREKEFQYKQKALDERMRHNLEMEKYANPDEKIRLAAEKAKIEAEKQRNVTDYKADAEYKKSLNKEEAKTFSKMEQDATAGIAAQPVLQEMADVVSDPVFEEIRQHPYLGHQEFSYYKKSGTPEQQKLAARFEVAANKLIADTAKGLNTRFTDKDLMLAQSMKINDNDSLEVAKAKAESLLYLHEIGQKRLEKALDIASTQRVSPFAAIKQADAALNANQIREDIRNKVYKNGGSLPSGVTEADIATTMQETGMTRAQVLEAYRKRIGK